MYKEVLDIDLEINILLEIINPKKSNNNSILFVNKRMLRIILKMKKYYVIDIWNGQSMNLNMSEIAAKNIFVYGKFDQQI